MNPSLSDERQELPLVQRARAVLDEAVRARRIVGGVVVAARDGAVVVRHAAGLADREAGTPMRLDTPFRLASLTKPVVSVVALHLLAQGALSLDDAVALHLPGFAPRLDGQPVTLTVRHLLTHTSGLGYAFLEPPDGPYHRACVSDGLDQPGLSLDENLRRLASLPLHFRPGDAFLYSLSTDVLGAVLERVAGEPLPALVERLVTRPLGLASIAFTPRDAAALATPYADGVPAPVRMTDGSYVPFAGAGAVFAPSRALDPRSYPSGGAGLVGNASDFLVFLEALRTRSRLAPPAWIDRMLSDQIANIQSPILGDGWGYGWGVGVLRDPVAALSPMHAGSVRWGGAYGHSWWIDPTARLSVVMLTNTTFEGMAGPTRTAMEQAFYER